MPDDGGARGGALEKEVPVIHGAGEYQYQITNDWLKVPPGMLPSCLDVDYLLRRRVTASDMGGKPLRLVPPRQRQRRLALAAQAVEQPGVVD